MALMPGADWVGPTVNRYIGGQTEKRGLVLHIEQGSHLGSLSWFKNPTAQSSAHFLNPKNGNLAQLVDTDDAAWAEMAGNHHWISVEHEGYSGDELTPSQLENDAKLYAWLHQTYNVVMESTDDPNGAGLGWHGMGGDAWGGHFDCPGNPIKNQRSLILARANEILGQKPVPTPTTHPGQPHPVFAGRYLKLATPMMHGADVLLMQQRLRERGWMITPDSWFGKLTDKVIRGFQADKGLTVDGIVGPITWDALWTAPVT